MSSVFARVLCDDDGTPAAAEAVRLAVRVVEPGGSVELLTVRPHGHGSPAGALLDAILRVEATLAVVPAPGHSRAVGIASGTAATFALHEAPCSVLIARPAPPHASGGIVVGVDGSPESELALAAAHELADRFRLPLRTVVGTGHARVDLDAARAAAPELEELHEDPVDLLAHLSEEAELLVVGSRGLKGVRSLGSVSERVAHDGGCPVLVVRGAADARAGQEEHLQRGRATATAA